MLRYHAYARNIVVDALRPSTLRTTRASATATVTSPGHPPHRAIAGPTDESGLLQRWVRPLV